MRSWPVPRGRATLPAPGGVWAMAAGAFATTTNVPTAQLEAFRASSSAASPPPPTPVLEPVLEPTELDELDIDWACEHLESLLEHTPLEQEWDVRVVLSPQLREAIASSRTTGVDDIEARILAQEGVLAAALGGGTPEEATDLVPRELLLRLESSDPEHGPPLVAKALRESLARRS